MSRFMPYAGSNREEALRRKKHPQLSHNIELREALRGMRAATRHWWTTTCAIEDSTAEERGDLGESIGVSIDVIDSLVWQLITLLSTNVAAVVSPDVRKLLGDLAQLTENRDGVKVCTLEARAEWVAKAIKACRAAADESFPPHGDN